MSRELVSDVIEQYKKRIAKLQAQLAISQQSDKEARAFNQQYFEEIKQLKEKIKHLESTVLGITK